MVGSLPLEEVARAEAGARAGAGLQRKSEGLWVSRGSDTDVFDRAEAASVPIFLLKLGFGNASSSRRGRFPALAGSNREVLDPTKRAEGAPQSRILRAGSSKVFAWGVQGVAEASW